MPNDEAIELLRYARDVVLASSANWTQGALHRDLPYGFHAHCAIGALYAGFTRARAWPLEAENALRLALPEDFLCWGIAIFNDAPWTTYEDVISLFDRAIKSLEDADA